MLKNINTQKIEGDVWGPGLAKTGQLFAIYVFGELILFGIFMPEIALEKCGMSNSLR